MASADSSRATAAEAVVWSTNTAPGAMPAKAPWLPSTTLRRSSSLPTQANTNFAPAAAAAGVAARSPPYRACQSMALAALRLKTVTWWPARARCPAIGWPITPRPRKATRCGATGS